MYLQELEEVFKKGQSERDDKDIERVEGMGFGRLVYWFENMHITRCT